MALISSPAQQLPPTHQKHQCFITNWHIKNLHISYLDDCTNPVRRKWQHGILLTKSWMLENFPSHEAKPSDLESFLAWMTRWVICHVVISNSQDWHCWKYCQNRKSKMFCGLNIASLYDYNEQRFHCSHLTCFSKKLVKWQQFFVVTSEYIGFCSH